MKIYYDTEFVDTGDRIHLLSIGMVREDGKEYYAVNQNLSYMLEAAHNPWLLKNVLPSLPVLIDHTDDLIPVDWDEDHPDFECIKPRKQIAKEVAEFCLSASTLPELWAWYGAYDHVVLSQLFGRMLDLPTDMPMWTNDLRQELARLGNPRYPEQASGEHNALEDARWNKQLGEYLAKLDGPITRS